MSENTRKVRVMGILNVTPDSFSDGGRFSGLVALQAHIEAMVAAGADIIDVGGESSRPFSSPVSSTDELARVIPAIELIRQNFQIPVSIDTTKAAVAEAALAAGADIINDISALRFDPDMLELVRRVEVPVIIMHMQGRPGDMQVDPVYDDVVSEIRGFFEDRLAWAEQQGVARDRFIVDPGIGFGKTVAHNLAILNNLAEFKKTGCQVLVGHSRKAFIGKILDREVDDRDVATAAVSALCVLNGADILRVHDVDKTVQAVKMAEAVQAATS